MAGTMDQSDSRCDLAGPRTSDNGGALSGKERVRKHDDKRRAENFSCLDLWIHGGLFDDLRTVASYRGLPMWTLLKRSRDMVVRYAGVLQ